RLIGKHDRIRTAPLVCSGIQSSDGKSYRTSRNDERGQSSKSDQFLGNVVRPCIKEMPMFEKLNQENKNVKVLLVSLDFDLDHDQSKITTFVMKKKLRSEVVILDGLIQTFGSKKSTKVGLARCRLL
ncbi:MAG: hypothetical protein QM734_15565, partial [Cyclobacteriaceae bacterium]